MDSDRWWHTTPETDPRRCTCFEMWGPCFPCGEHHYRILLRGKRYYAEKNGKNIGEFAELKPAQRCIEASAQRAEAWRARRMAQAMAKTRAALADEMRREVPFERLFAAMFSVLQRRHERTGGGEFLELTVSDPERMLDEFLQTCTIQQVRMLREIALEAGRGQAAVASMRMRVPMRRGQSPNRSPDGTARLRLEADLEGETRQR
jgi:hypothetical protein